MANLKNAKKKILVNNKKSIRNNNYLASMKTSIKNLEKAIEKGNKEESTNLLKIAVKRIDKASGAGAAKKNKCSREKSRLTKKVNAME